MSWDELIAVVTDSHPDVKVSQMFSAPCVKRDTGKVTFCSWQGDVVFKLVDESARTKALALDGAELFDPGLGRRMKEWVLVPAAHSGRWAYREAMGTREEQAARERFEDIADAICAWHEEARASKLFSMPCVKRSGKFVFGLGRDGMVFKLTDPEAHRRALSLPGAHLFDPSGRGEAFRQWVVVPPARADEWEALAYEALGQDHGVLPEVTRGEIPGRG